LQTTQVVVTETITNSSQAIVANNGQEIITTRYSFQKKKHCATLDGRNARKKSLSKVMCHAYTIPDSREDTPQGQESGKQQEASRHGLLHGKNQQKVGAIMCKKLYPLEAR
jgi:hypothetical protein